MGKAPEAVPKIIAWPAAQFAEVCYKRDSRRRFFQRLARCTGKMRAPMCLP
jgi:hypothetical protein